MTLRTLLDRLAELEAELRKSKALKVNGARPKEMATEIATDYFTDCRPQIAKTTTDHEKLAAFDEKWQHLVRLAHGNNARTSYRNTIRALKRTAADFSVEGISRPIEVEGQISTVTEFSPAEQLLIETLENYVPSAAASYRQGVLDLDPNINRVSYRGTAVEFRESLRETIDHLAPDDEVESEQGYKHEANQTKPTMKQKVRFVLKSRNRRKTQRETTEKSIGVVESLCGEVARAVYNRASLSTHVETTRSEVLQIKRYVDTVLFDLLEISER